nr:MAG TPA: hypothetical protein [Caudoviricetes sp.]
MNCTASLRTVKAYSYLYSMRHHAHFFAQSALAIPTP